MNGVNDSPVLIIGLGNPGPHYVGTRHNVGFDVINELCSRAGANLSVNKKTNTEIAEITAGFLAPRPTVIARPRSFMNLSGGPVKALATYFRIPPSDITVIHDELELDFGTIKLRLGGGDHGHNGLRSVTKSLNTKDYKRLSIGIGRPPGRMDPGAFVLKRWSKNEAAQLPILCADAADALLTSLS